MSDSSGPALYTPSWSAPTLYAQYKRRAKGIRDNSGMVSWLLRLGEIDEQDFTHCATGNIGYR